jgi:hypothetical protein
LTSNFWRIYEVDFPEDAHMKASEGFLYLPGAYWFNISKKSTLEVFKLKTPKATERRIP